LFFVSNDRFTGYLSGLWDGITEEVKKYLNILSYIYPQFKFTLIALTMR